jgi:hypothetical protein
MQAGEAIIDVNDFRKVRAHHEIRPLYPVAKHDKINIVELDVGSKIDSYLTSEFQEDRTKKSSN